MVGRLRRAGGFGMTVDSLGLSPAQSISRRDGVMKEIRRAIVLGSLKPGSVGDATILSVKDGKFIYEDVVGERVTGDKKIIAEGTVIAGKWWHPKRSSKFAKVAPRTQEKVE